MQIASFLAHYQIVYINFDLSLFFLISCMVIERLLEAKRACIGFGLRENSLQSSTYKGISCLQKRDTHRI